MNTIIAMTFGLCAANRHQICGPADSFPPPCDGCVREKLEVDARRYRYLRSHLGLGFAVHCSTQEGSIAGGPLLDEAIDAASSAVKDDFLDYQDRHKGGTTIEEREDPSGEPTK